MPATVVNELVRKFFLERGIAIRQLQIYLNEREKRYDVYIEPTERHLPADGQTVSELDSMLARQLTGYNLFRNELHMLQELTVTEMKQGWQEWLYDKASRSAGMTNGQMKLSLIAREPAGKEFTCHCSR